MSRGAVNAWQERDWTRQDIMTVAQNRRLDFETATGRNKAANLVDGFYSRAAQLIERGIAPVAQNDRLLRTLDAMTRMLRENGRVEFGRDADARHFPMDMRQRYGEDVMVRFGNGDGRALAFDFAERASRCEVASAIVTAVVQHESMGISLKQAREAQRHFAGIAVEGQARDGDRQHSRGRHADGPDRER